MPTGMGVIDPKFVKGGRKLKKTKLCTIPLNLVRNESFSNKGQKLSSMWTMKKRKSYHNEEYAKRCTNLMGKLETYNQEKSRMYQ